MFLRLCSCSKDYLLFVYLNKNLECLTKLSKKKSGFITNSQNSKIINSTKEKKNANEKKLKHQSSPLFLLQKKLKQTIKTYYNYKLQLIKDQRKVKKL